MKLFRLLLLTFLPFIAFAENTLKVGVVLPLSGMVAPMGQSVNNGLELYKKDNPEKIKNITFVIEDSKYDGKETSTVVNKLITTDNVDMIFVWGVTPGEIAAPIVNQKNTPTIIATYLTHSEKYKSVVELGPSQDSCLDPMIEYLAKGSSEKNDYGAISIDVGSAIYALDSIDERMGNVMPREIVSSDTTDFKSIITKFKSKNIKRVIMVLFPEQALTFFRQAKALSYEVSVLGGDIFAEEKFFNEAKTLTPHLFISYGRVAPWLEEKCRTTYHNASYLSEVGYGYSLGIISSMLVNRKDELHGNTFHKLANSLPMSDLPLTRPVVKTNEKGALTIHTSYELFEPK
jgi:hypothetical protein